MIISQVNGATIKRLRLERGLSQFQLACDCEIERNVISLIECNKRPGVKLWTILKLARYFNVKIEDLLKS